jgi:L-aminopeptidase/D-esterase-like protein
VVRFESAVPVALDVRGGASGTFDTASLGLDATFGRRSALFFAGGSLYGLDAARGIRTRLREEGVGDRVFGNPNAIVRLSGAILFDLPPRRSPLPDYARLGYEAARAAASGPVPEGSVGAGAGARVAKYRGRAGSCPGGIGSYALRSSTGRWVGALLVVNAVGAVRDPEAGRWVRTARDRRGRPTPPTFGRADRSGDAGTTLALVATDEALDRRELFRVALRAHDGIARAVWPSHTAGEGDLAFAASTRERSARDPSPGDSRRAEEVAALAERAVAAAAVRAVRFARREPDREALLSASGRRPGRAGGPYPSAPG